MFRLLRRVAGLFCLVSVVAYSCGNFDSLRQQAEDARKQHNIPAACDFYQQALAIDNQWTEGWWHLGSLQFVSGHLEQAEAALMHVAALKPEMAEAWGMLGLSELQRQKYQQALTYLDKSASLPFSVVPDLRDPVLTNRAYLFSRTGQFERGLDALKQFVHGPPTPELLTALGIAGLRMKLLPNEVPSSDRELTLAAGRVEYQFMTADPQAKQSSEALASQYPNANVYYLLGMAWFPTDRETAIEYFQKALVLNADDALSESMLAYSEYAEHKNLSEAAKLAQKAVDADPGDAGFLYVLGVILDSLGQPKAVAALEAATRIQPQNVEYHIALAAAYARAGQASEASAERRRALDLKFRQAG